MNRIEDFLKRNEWEGRPEGMEWGQWCIQPAGPINLGRQSALEAIREVLEHASRRSDETKHLKRQLQELSRKVEKHEILLNELFGEKNIPLAGSFEEWCSTSAANKFRGKHVLFEENTGRVVGANSLDELFEKIGGTLLPNMIVGFVPSL